MNARAIDVRGNPHHVRSKLSVKAAANLFTQQVNDTLDVRKAEFQALRLAMATPEPPCPVLLAHGAYTLIELIHPQHLVRAGLSAGNCLILKRGTDVRAIRAARPFPLRRQATITCASLTKTN